MSLIKSKIKNTNEDNWLNDWKSKFIETSNQLKSSGNFIVVNEQVAKLFKKVQHGNVY